jgi:predicted nucleic acid-binding protein
VALLNTLRGQRVYLDTNVFIYALEARPEFVDALTKLFEGVVRSSVVPSSSRFPKL